MNDQQRAAMQMALEAFESACNYIDVIGGTSKAHRATITALRESLRNASERMAQPQGEWVDLTDDDLMEVLCEMAASNVVNDSVFAKAVIAKFKEKNTPPVVPQGCHHRIADARNPIVKSGYMCVDCGALFSAADHTIQPVVPQGEPVANEEVHCKDHPDAPHGFDRNSSHTLDRYVCECEFWEPEEPKLYTQSEFEAAIEATKEKAASIAAGMLNDIHAYGFGVPAAIRSMK